MKRTKMTMGRTTTREWWAHIEDKTKKDPRRDERKRRLVQIDNKIVCVDEVFKRKLLVGARTSHNDSKLYITEHNSNLES